MHHVFLIRHGTTEAIEKHLIQGSTDSPLSAKGREEAHSASEALKNIPFKAIFSSPMGSAMETARILADPHPDVEIIQLHDLHEMDFGFYELKPFFASPDEAPRGLRRLSLLVKIMLAQATGEPLKHVSQRASSSWEQIFTMAPDGEILIVSHGVLLNYFLKFLLPEATYEAIKPVSLHTCSITELKVYSPGKAEKMRFNDTAHLK